MPSMLQPLLNGALRNAAQYYCSKPFAMSNRRAARELHFR